MKFCTELSLTNVAGMPPDAVLCVAENTPPDLDAAAAEFLAADELAGFRSMKAIERRRAEWLLGRITAKEAVCLRAFRTEAKKILPNEFAIGATADGKPFVGGVKPRVEISISHSRGVAAAVAWDAENGPAGIDLEFPRKISSSLVSETFTAAELALVGGEQNAIKLWCLKEAAAKATGEGIRFRLQNIAVVSLAELRSDAGRFACTLLEHRRALIAVARLRR